MTKIKETLADAPQYAHVVMRYPDGKLSNGGKMIQPIFGAEQPLLVGRHMNGDSDLDLKLPGSAARAASRIESWIVAAHQDYVDAPSILYVRHTVRASTTTQNARCTGT